VSVWDQYRQCVLYKKPKPGLLGTPDPVRDAAAAYKERYGIADNQCFSCSEQLPGHTLFARGGRENIFRGLNRDGKLIIIAHGKSNHCGGFDPQGLANFLWDHGLHEVGLIAFKCCLVGKSEYLPKLKNWLASFGVDVGWFVGYRHGVWTLSGAHEASGLFDLVVRQFSKGHEKKRSDRHRVRVVKGNIDVNVEGSRRYRT